MTDGSQLGKYTLKHEFIITSGTDEYKTNENSYRSNTHEQLHQAPLVRLLLGPQIHSCALFKL